MNRKKMQFLLWPGLVLCTGICYGQPQARFSCEAGVTYFSNNAIDSARHLTDFIAITFNLRFILQHADYGGWGIEAPLSLRIKSNENGTGHFGVHVPVLITYSIGSGSGGSAEVVRNKKTGFTAGVGWGYFYQHTQSAREALSRFNEKLRTSGPEIQFGIRLPVRKKIILFDRVNPSDLILAIKGNYLVNLRNRNNDIGSLSFLFGFDL
jgi:hypothetical protein